MKRQAVSNEMIAMGPLLVPRCCLGTMTFGHQCSKAVAWSLLDDYVAGGGNFVDTAEVYPVPQRMETIGLTEDIVGEWLAKRCAADQGFRAKLVIATKVAGPSGTKGAVKLRARTLGHEVSDEEQQRINPNQIRLALDSSLKRLQTSYVDLYQIHWPDRAVPLWGRSQYSQQMRLGAYDMKGKDAKLEPEIDLIQGNIDAAVKTMSELVASGKIKAWGLSNETPLGIALFCEAAKRLGGPLPVSLQQDFSLLDRRFEEGLVEACTHYGLKLLAYGPLCGGTLTGKYHHNNSIDSNSNKNARHVLHPDFQKRYHDVDAKEATSQYLDIAKRNGISGTQLALGWAATRWYMGSVILGANTLEQLKEDLDAVENANNVITLGVEKEIDAVHMRKKNPIVSL